MRIHPAADIFPLDEEHIDDLAADIKANGLRVPIETFDGMVIDGRRRLQACERVGVKPKTKKIKELADPVAYVLSLNLHRRHLEKSQWAMVGARAKDVYELLAKERMRTGGKVGGELAGRGRKKADRGVEKFPHPYSDENGKARDKAGAAVGVSGKLIDAASKVLESGDKELIGAVDSGEKSVTAAAKETKPEPAAMVDEIGVEVSEHLLPTFRNREKFSEAMSLVRKLKNVLADLAEMPGGEVLRESMHLKGKADEARYRHAKLEEVGRDIKFAEPYAAVCAYCHDGGKHIKELLSQGKKCPACKGRGWQTKASWQQSPKDYRAEASGNPLEGI